jgi:hypothetical protein
VQGSVRKLVMAFTGTVLIGGLAAIVSCYPERPGEQEKMALYLPKGPSKRPQGMNALVVRVGSAQPFTTQDVVNYFKTHNLPMNMSSTGQFQVESVEFLTDRQVSERLGGASPGLTADEKVAVATLRGSFVFTGPSGGGPARFSRAYAVFDAKTGNLLMIGTLEQQQTPR